MSLIRDYIDGQFQNETEGEVGIAGFTTVARISDNIKQAREAPEIYLEDGSHVNDHIIRKPVTVSIDGNISNVHVDLSPALEYIRDIETIVGQISQYLPGRTQSQLSLVAGITADIQQQIDRIDSAITTGKNVANFLGFTGEEGKTNIEKFIDHMDGILNSDVLIEIDAPNRTYGNMCILSFNYTVENTSEGIDFSIEAQELRFAQTVFSEISQNPATSTDGQHSEESNKGAQEGEEVEQSFLNSQFERFGIFQ